MHMTLGTVVVVAVVVVVNGGDASLLLVNAFCDANEMCQQKTETKIQRYNKIVVCMICNALE